MSPPEPTVSEVVRRHAMLVKMAVIAVLTLALLIPLSMVKGVLKERLVRRDKAIAEITRSWGGTQQVIGPVLVVPVPAANGESALAHFLPADLAVEATLVPESRRRGIYQAAVYRSEVTIAGTFARPDLAALGVTAAQLDWSEAYVAFAIPDLRGVADHLLLDWGDTQVPLRPGARLEGFATGIHAPVRAADAQVTFRVTLALNGSGGFSVAPLGALTSLRLASTWPSPSFRGAFLPAQRDVRPSGFEAEWRVSQFGRDYPQQWLSFAGQPEVDARLLTASLFGGDLYVTIDAYRNVERAIKYGVLFVALVFLVFFLFEVRSGVRVHPVQYTLAGLAVALFFLILLALAEFVPFAIAYLAAAGSCTVLVALHTLAVLGTRRRALVGAAALTGGFGFLYVVLQLEDYALIAGAAGLLVLLAVVMFATRRVDWYAREMAT